MNGLIRLLAPWEGSPLSKQPICPAYTTQCLIDDCVIDEFIWQDKFIEAFGREGESEHE